jgi:hypothetical protein
MGPVEYFIQIAGELGRNFSERAIYVYLSDNFFIEDDEPDFYGLMTNVLVGIMLAYIRDDRSVDFVLMSRERSTIYEKAQEFLKIVIDRLMDNIFTSTYKMGSFTVDYQRMDDEFFAIYKRNKDETYTRKDMKDDWTYWDNMICLVRFFSPKGSKRQADILAEEAAKLESFVLNLATWGKPGRYHNSLREFIYRRFEELGIAKTAKKKLSSGSAPRLPSSTQRVIQNCQDADEDKDGEKVHPEG